MRTAIESLIRRTFGHLEHEAELSGQLAAQITELTQNVADLDAAIQTSETLRRHARSEEMFRPLHALARFQELVGSADEPI